VKHCCGYGDVQFITCHLYCLYSSLPMGRGFVGLARALRWAGPGSLGRARCGASWAGSGRGSAKPGLPSQPSNYFLPCVPEVLNMFEL